MVAVQFEGILQAHRHNPIMYPTDLLQGSDEWKQLRRTKIGSSDAAAIMGVSPWATPYQLWMQKMNGDEVEENQAMRRGTVLEPLARQKFYEMTGIDVCPVVRFSREYDWMMASIDGLSFDEKTLVEIKCPGKADHALAKDGKVPDKYYPQLQHQMIVCDLQEATYFSFDGEEGIMFKVPRSEPYCATLIEVEKKFYACMTNFDPPALGKDDYVSKDDDATWHALAEEWKKTYHDFKHLEKKEKELKQQLIKIAGENAYGAGIRLTKYIRQGNVDYSAIPELSGVDLSRYRKKSTEAYRISESE